MKQQRIIFAVAMSMAFAAHAEPKKLDAEPGWANLAL